jgi:tetratricopeptide (TPR) repeat protein
MAADDRSQRRERFMRELASRDLYEWFGIPPDAGDEAIREAAEAKRRELSTTPMPQKKRSMERAFCDQGEKALLRPDVRREYDALLRGGSAVGTGAERTAARNVAEREARLKAARDRIQQYGADDARMAPGAATLLASVDVRTELQAERSAAGGIDSAEQALRTARQARATGRYTRALAHAERAHQLNPSPGALTVLAGARRDVGDLSGSESAVRESLRLLPTARENAPGWIALSATLRARGDLEGAAQAALRVIEEDDEDAYGWRALAMALADQGEALRAADAWERSARLGLDVPGALAGLQQLRKDSLARGERLPAADVEARISRLRER